MKTKTVLTMVVLVLSGCAVQQPNTSRYCESEAVIIDAAFEGGNFSECQFNTVDTALLTIRPEDAPPINQSAWFAFRASGKRATTLNVELRYVDGYARYWPKISEDGKNWRRLDSASVQTSDDGQSMTLSVQMSETPVLIAANELKMPDDYAQWLLRQSKREDIVGSTLGHSVEGRPIQMLRTPAREETVMLFGRQHPPEVTGAVAMVGFVNEVLSDSELARRFRARFSVIVIPLINPDGVVHGHWRHNMNGVDLNRDWGPFTQPETQSIAALLQRLEASGTELKAMLDFHSTRSSLFYTQLPEPQDKPVDFASEWLNAARARLPHFPFKHDPRPPSGQDNTKNFFHKNYGIPAITYELGDEVPAADIENAMPTFAQTFMRELLER